MLSQQRTRQVGELTSSSYSKDFNHLSLVAALAKALHLAFVLDLATVPCF